MSVQPRFRKGRQQTATHCNSLQLTATQSCQKDHRVFPERDYVCKASFWKAETLQHTATHLCQRGKTLQHTKNHWCRKDHRDFPEEAYICKG
mmetsp:Transcript_6058/g.9647  ORF Transcript_6058/g.9647 Transcript_6058/m.9647 type:complete len:92 (-) Transcript_6058:66-341(-)